MHSDRAEVVTFEEAREPLLQQVWPLKQRVWPAFMLEDAVAARYWQAMEERFPDCQWLLVEEGVVLAAGHAVPFHYDGTLSERGWDWVLARAVRDHDAGRWPNAVSAIEISVDLAYRGRGLSHRMVRELRAIARRRRAAHLVAPVRPAGKAAYPLAPMERYAAWTREDGLPFDPWLRVHARQGARRVGVAPASMEITGSLDDWQAWTGMAFPDSGPYIVPGALCPVDIDVEADRGVYREPNVWMRHDVNT